MAKNMGLILTLAVCFFCVGGLLIAESKSPEQSQKEHIQEILQKAGEYCDRLNRIALFFVCLENVEEKIHFPYLSQNITPDKTEASRLVYDYQLIRKETIEEKRILVKENGKRVHQTDAPLKTQRFKYQCVVFGPIGLFGFKAQSLCDYSIEKTAKLWGKPALVVKVVPKDPNGETKRLYGKAWLDPSNGSVMKIEWEETSVGNYQAILDFAREIGALPALSFDTEYRFEKNGIRFPSRCAIKENYSGGLLQRFVTKCSLNIDYRDYKFFTVETDIKEKRAP